MEGGRERTQEKKEGVPPTNFSHPKKITPALEQTVKRRKGGKGWGTTKQSSGERRGLGNRR